MESGEVRSILSVALLALGSTVSATPPQQPIARGPYESMLAASSEARRCGMLKLRKIDANEAALFNEGQVRDDQVHCLWAWMTPRGRELNFKPRWWSDDFTKDRP